MHVTTPIGTNLKYQRIQYQDYQSHYRNKFVEKEIPTLYNKFHCLNIDKDATKTTDVNDNGLSNNIKSDQVSRSHQKLPSKRPQVVVND